MSMMKLSLVDTCSSAAHYQRGINRSAACTRASTAVAGAACINSSGSANRRAQRMGACDGCVRAWEHVMGVYTGEYDEYGGMHDGHMGLLPLPQLLVMQ